MHFLVIEKSKREKKFYSDLLILNDIIENDKHNQIIIFGENGNVIYANKCARQNICDLSMPLSKQYKQIEKGDMIKLLPEGKYNERDRKPIEFGGRHL